MSVISGTQMAAAAAAQRAPGSTVEDDKSALGDPLGGWKGGETPDAHSALNLSNAQRPFAFRSPSNAGIGANTIGTWQGMGQAWHERYKNQD